LALSEDNHEIVCVPNVADQSLVSRRSIRKLLIKIETILAFPNVESHYRKNHNEILTGLYELPNEKQVIEFARICSVDEISRFTVKLVRNERPSGGLLAELLELDKRKWNFQLHLNTFREYLKTKYDPPIWLFDAMIENSLPQLIDICCQFNRGDVLEEVFVEVQVRNVRISRYWKPLLEKAKKCCHREVHELIDEIITIAV
jgi:hypothetical protein